MHLPLLRLICTGLSTPSESPPIPFLLKASYALTPCRNSFPLFPYSTHDDCKSSRAIYRNTRGGIERSRRPHPIRKTRRLRGAASENRHEAARQIDEAQSVVCVFCLRELNEQTSKGDF